MRKKQFYQRINLIFLLLLISLFYANCKSIDTYSNINTSAGIETLNLISNGVYEYSWMRYYDVGPIDDTIMHTGRWINVNDTLILNSLIFPTNYDDFIVNEEIINLDSISIIIKSNEKIPFFFISPSRIRVNDKYYYINKVDKDYIKLVLPKVEIKYIIVSGYPIYIPKSKETNLFTFMISELQGSKLLYPENTFFLNEKFLLKNDSIFRLDENGQRKVAYKINFKK